MCFPLASFTDSEHASIILCITCTAPERLVLVQWRKQMEQALRNVDVVGESYFHDVAELMAADGLCPRKNNSEVTKCS